MNFRRQRALVSRRMAQSRAMARRAIRLGGRADGVLGMLLFVLASASVATGIGLAYLHRSNGWFAPPVSRPVADDRILNNIRKETSPFVGAAIVPGEAALYAARRSGTVHRLQLSTLLWSDESLRSLAPDLSSEIALLQPGCGHHAPEPNGGCPEPSALFAVTEGGGVAVRRDGQWIRLLGDTRFVDRHQKPVGIDDILSAAITGDGRWLVLGTRAQGIGLYDLSRRVWSRLPNDVDDRIVGAAAPAKITQIVDDGQRLLVGTDHGLVLLTTQQSGFQATRVAGVDGRVRDVVALPGYSLVLSGEPCRDDPKAECFGLRRIDAGGKAGFVAGAIDRLPGLSDGTVFHVAAKGTEILALTRDNGVFAYVLEVDPDRGTTGPWI